ncbi:MAG: heme exporter protein CcmB, partial [Desulfovibrio sp.]|nr:heme exporter protein CcmB [Desulfovibrio sp.]
WLASSFCQVLVFNAVYAYEETAGQRLGLLLAPAPTAAVWLGKAMAGFVLVFLSQLVFLPATAVFLAQEPSHCLAEGLAMLALADTGLAALGSLLGALAQGQAARESLLSLLVFPLLVPLLLSAISVFAAVFGDAAPDGVASWLGFAGAFDAIFLGAGLLLFRFIYTGEE